MSSPDSDSNDVVAGVEDVNETGTEEQEREHYGVRDESLWEDGRVLEDLKVKLDRLESSMLARDEMAAYLKRHLEDEERRTKETGRMDQRILDRMRRRGEAMKKRGWTLRRVGAEVARCREEELKWADFQDQQVAESQVDIEDQRLELQRSLDAVYADILEVFPASDFQSLSTSQNRAAKILSDILILEYMEVEKNPNISSSRMIGMEAESTKAVKNLLGAWGPMVSRERWEFIKAQDGFDRYAEISEGQIARFGHLLVV